MIMNYEHLGCGNMGTTGQPNIRQFYLGYLARLFAYMCAGSSFIEHDYISVGNIGYIFWELVET